MKILSAVVISFFSLQASAQWLTKLPWMQKRERLPKLIRPVIPFKTASALNFSITFKNFNTGLGRSRYSLNAEEAAIMKDLRHSARYGSDAMRIQFDRLAVFYFGQNRFSEAKWYLLRSNAISRRQNNYEQIVGSLVVLADVKSNLGDFIQADADLLEAKNIAASHHLAPNLLLIEQHTQLIHQHKQVGLKYENHYAELL